MVRWSLVANVLMLVANGAMFYALLVFVVAEPATVDGVDPFSEIDEAAEAEKQKGDPSKEIRQFFERTSDLLDRAARKNGTNPADVLPTRQAIDEAVETRTIHSDQSQEVLQKLREGFDLYDLDWPTVMPER
jgi:hypothetical protein